MDWIKNLKVGDKVVVRFMNYPNASYSVEEVQGITKTGRIKLNRYVFLPNGVIYGADNKDRYTLLEYTQEMQDKINLLKMKERVNHRLLRLHSEKLTDKQYMGIYKVLFGENADEGNNA